jgi:hypothetical protein
MTGKGSNAENAETLMFDNGVRAHHAPRSSVLIAFAQNDPTPLLAGLSQLAASVDVVVLDNGSGDAPRAERVTAEVARLALPARFVRLARRAPRAATRNRLALEARAARRLVLDADAPGDHLRSLRRWLGSAHTASAA